MNRPLTSIPDLGGSASSPSLAVFFPQHRQPVVMEVVDHRQTEAAVVTDVDEASAVDGAAQSRVDVSLTEAFQTRVLVEQPSKRTVNAEKF